MKSSFFLALALLSFSSLSFADVGVSEVLSCGSGQGPAHFVLRRTAVPSLQKGTLSLAKSGNEYEMNCNAESPKAKKGADQTTKLYSCVENRAGEGLITASISSGGLAGLTQARFYRESVLPTMPPKALVTLPCKLN